MIQLFKMCISSDQESKTLALEIIKNMPNVNFSGMKVYLLSRISYTTPNLYVSEIQDILKTVNYPVEHTFVINWVKVMEVMMNNGTCIEEYEVLAKILGLSFQSMFEEVDPGLAAAFVVSFKPNV